MFSCKLYEHKYQWNKGDRSLKVKSETRPSRKIQLRDRHAHNNSN